MTMPAWQLRMAMPIGRQRMTIPIRQLRMAMPIGRQRMTIPIRQVMEIFIKVILRKLSLMAAPPRTMPHSGLRQKTIKGISIKYQGVVLKMSTWKLSKRCLPAM